MPCVEGVSDSRYEEVGCLYPREMVAVDSGVNGDVASEASANASQGGSCIRSYVAEATRRVGAGEGLDVDCVGSAKVGSKEPRVARNNAGRRS